MNNPTIETDIAEVLKEIKDDQKKLLAKVNQIEVDINILKTDNTNIKETVKKIEGAQQAQIWTLIGVLITAVGGFVIAVARNVLTFN